MTKKHIPFSESNFDDPVDDLHLQDCKECQRGWAVFRFLGLQVKSIPRLDAPPFFAQRVAHLAHSTAAPFALLLKRTAQQLVPVLLSLVMATGFLLYQMTDSETIEYQSEVLFEVPIESDIAFEGVVDSLNELPEEEYGEESR